MPVDRKCCVPGCYNVTPYYHHFHGFPHNVERCKIWLDNIGDENLKKLALPKLQNKYVCHLHFEEKYRGRECRTLTRKAVPTIFPLQLSLEMDSCDDDDDDFEPFTRVVDKSKKVLVTSNDFPECGLQMLRNSYMLLQTRYSGYDIAEFEDNKKEIAELIEGVTAVIWATLLPLTKELLDKAGPELKVVACASSSYDHVDVAELKERGIKLSNTPDIINAAVADMTIGLAIAASRRFNEAIIKVKKGNWKAGFQDDLGLEIRGSVVGIVGLGGIGQAILRRLKGFEVKQFLYTNHSEKIEGKALGAEYVTLDHLLKESDFVILACALTPETKNLINKNTLAKMKPQSVLVNIGRGGCVNHDDLYDALKNKQIFAAGLDVMTPEPLPKDHPLTTLPNCFMTPHIGSATTSTRNKMAELTALNAIQAIRDGTLLTEVDL